MGAEIPYFVLGHLDFSGYRSSDCRTDGYSDAYLAVTEIDSVEGMLFFCQDELLAQYLERQTHPVARNIVVDAEKTQPLIQRRHPSFGRPRGGIARILLRNQFVYHVLFLLMNNGLGYDLLEPVTPFIIGIIIPIIMTIMIIGIMALNMLEKSVPVVCVG